MAQPDQGHHARLPGPEFMDGPLHKDPTAVEIECDTQQGLHPIHSRERHCTA
jgi:hypothetical protein